MEVSGPLLVFDQRTIVNNDFVNLPPNNIVVCLMANATIQLFQCHHLRQCGPLAMVRQLLKARGLWKLADQLSADQFATSENVDLYIIPLGREICQGVPATKIRNL